ncbi:MAG: GHKL domain-containing protein [Lachnospiraceae bacterium]|nr:GHKL domain-containing protein [Candidatus Equihabitans merdae]
MDDEVVLVFYNLIVLAIRMMPTFICLAPKYRNKENIAAVSVYVWTVMIFVQELLPLSRSDQVVFSGVFAMLFFMVLLIFFEGRALEKAFLYISAWLFATLTTSVNILVARFIGDFVHLSYPAICLILSLPVSTGFYFFVKYYLKDRVNAIYDTISNKNSSLLLAVPTSFFIIITWGRHSLFSEETLLAESLEYDIFFLVLCIIMITVYIILIDNILHMINAQRYEDEMQFMKKLMVQEKQHYNQVLEYQEQIRIIRHDFRHHIHALKTMDKAEQTKYLQSLNLELDAVSNIFYCENQALNSLLSDYNERAKSENIDFRVKISLPKRLPLDDLTLCIIVGNLLENAMEASLKLNTGRQIELNARWIDDALMMIVENAFDGKVNAKGDKLLSTKGQGGLGLISIKRLLNHEGDDFDISYTEDRFIAMVKIADRTLG